MNRLHFFVCLCAAFLLSSTSMADEYPLRQFFQEVSTIELERVKADYDNGEAIIVDVRTRAEFETIHIKGAFNVPFNHAFFARHLAEIVPEDFSKRIILYDNQFDSVKAYQAADEALIAARITNVYAFDAGISAWAKAYPEDTMVQGKELKDPVKQLLPVEKFARKNLDFETFKTKAASSNAMVIDLRDGLERRDNNVLPGFEKAFVIPADKLVKNIISKGHMKDKQLFIFDQAGQRVQWIMYYLVDNGYQDFYFLSGGATSVLQDQSYSVSASNKPSMQLGTM